MTPEQLKALMSWTIALHETVVTGDKTYENVASDNLYAAFGFIVNTRGEPARPEPAKDELHGEIRCTHLATRCPCRACAAWRASTYPDI